MIFSMLKVFFKKLVLFPQKVQNILLCHIAM
jgi:hypothetical protein